MEAVCPTGNHAGKYDQRAAAFLVVTKPPKHRQNYSKKAELFL